MLNLKLLKNGGIKEPKSLKNTDCCFMFSRETTIERGNSFFMWIR